jgi:hypothetical protein
MKVSPAGVGEVGRVQKESGRQDSNLRHPAPRAGTREVCGKSIIRTSVSDEVIISISKSFVNSFLDVRASILKGCFYERPLMNK